MSQSTTSPVTPEPPFTSTDAADEQASAEANMLSLIAIPVEQCPWPAVRLALLRWAIEGADVYAYTPMGSASYVIWHRQSDPAVESRFSPQQWAEKYGYL